MFFIVISSVSSKKKKTEKKKKEKKKSLNKLLETTIKLIITGYLNFFWPKTPQWVPTNYEY